jgi:hypothetical protein
MSVELKFASAEEAAKWPEGTIALCGCQSVDRLYWQVRALTPDFITWGADSHYMRLPETLPEAEATP